MQTKIASIRDTLSKKKIKYFNYSRPAFIRGKICYSQTLDFQQIVYNLQGYFLRNSHMYLHLNKISNIFES